MENSIIEKGVFVRNASSAMSSSATPSIRRPAVRRSVSVVAMSGLTLSLVAPVSTVAGAASAAGSSLDRIEVTKDYDGTGHGTNSQTFINSKNGYPKEVADDTPTDGVVATGDRVGYLVKLTFNAGPKRDVVMHMSPKDGLKLVDEGTNIGDGQRGIYTAHVKKNRDEWIVTYTIAEGVSGSFTRTVVAEAYINSSRAQIKDSGLNITTENATTALNMAATPVNIVQAPMTDVVLTSSSFIRSKDGKKAEGYFDVKNAIPSANAAFNMHKGVAQFSDVKVPVNVREFPAGTTFDSYTREGDVIYVPMAKPGTSTRVRFTSPVTGSGTDSDVLREFKAWVDVPRGDLDLPPLKNLGLDRENGSGQDENYATGDENRGLYNGSYYPNNNYIRFTETKPRDEGVDMIVSPYVYAPEVKTSIFTDASKHGAPNRYIVGKAAVSENTQVVVGSHTSGVPGSNTVLSAVTWDARTFDYDVSRNNVIDDQIRQLKADGAKTVRVWYTTENKFAGGSVTKFAEVDSSWKEVTGSVRPTADTKGIVFVATYASTGSDRPEVHAVAPLVTKVVSGNTTGSVWGAGSNTDTKITNATSHVVPIMKAPTKEVFLDTNKTVPINRGPDDTTSWKFVPRLTGLVNDSDKVGTKITLTMDHYHRDVVYTQETKDAYNITKSGNTIVFEPKDIASLKVNPDERGVGAIVYPKIAFTTRVSLMTPLMADGGYVQKIVAQADASGAKTSAKYTVSGPVSKRSDMYSFKDAVHKVVERGNDVEWTLNVVNGSGMGSDGESAYVDILPAVGGAEDARIRGMKDDFKINIRSIELNEDESVSGAYIEFTNAPIKDISRDDPYKAGITWNRDVRKVGGYGAVTAIRVVVPSFGDKNHVGAAQVRITARPTGVTEGTSLENVLGPLVNKKTKKAVIKQSNKARVVYDHGSISGALYWDGDKNSHFAAPTDSGIAHVDVELYRKNERGGFDKEASTKTGADGSYVFTDIPSGEYEVRVKRDGSTLGKGKDINGALPKNITTVYDKVVPVEHTAQYGSNSTPDVATVKQDFAAEVTGVDFGFYVASPDLKVDKSKPRVVEETDTYQVQEYDVTVANTGVGQGSSVVVSDELSNGQQFVSAQLKQQQDVKAAAITTWNTVFMIDNNDHIWNGYAMEMKDSGVSVRDVVGGDYEIVKTVGGSIYVKNAHDDYYVFYLNNQNEVQHNLVFRMSDPKLSPGKVKRLYFSGYESALASSVSGVIQDSDGKWFILQSGGGLYDLNVVNNSERNVYIKDVVLPNARTSSNKLLLLLSDGSLTYGYVRGDNFDVSIGGRVLNGDDNLEKYWVSNWLSADTYIVGYTKGGKWVSSYGPDVTYIRADFTADDVLAVNWHNGSMFVQLKNKDVYIWSLDSRENSFRKIERLEALVDNTLVDDTLNVGSWIFSVGSNGSGNDVVAYAPGYKRMYDVYQSSEKNKDDYPLSYMFGIGGIRNNDGAGAVNHPSLPVYIDMSLDEFLKLQEEMRNEVNGHIKITDAYRNTKINSIIYSKWLYPEYGNFFQLTDDGRWFSGGFYAFSEKDYNFDTSSFFGDGMFTPFTRSEYIDFSDGETSSGEISTHVLPQSDYSVVSTADIVDGMGSILVKDNITNAYYMAGSNGGQFMKISMDHIIKNDDAQSVTPTAINGNTLTFNVPQNMLPGRPVTYTVRTRVDKQKNVTYGYNQAYVRSDDTPQNEKAPTVPTAPKDEKAYTDVVADGWKLPVKGTQPNSSISEDTDRVDQVPLRVGALPPNVKPIEYVTVGGTTFIDVNRDKKHNDGDTPFGEAKVTVSWTTPDGKKDARIVTPNDKGQWRLAGAVPKGSQVEVYFDASGSTDPQGKPWVDATPKKVTKPNINAEDTNVNYGVMSADVDTYVKDVQKINDKTYRIILTDDDKDGHGLPVTHEWTVEIPDGVSSVTHTGNGGITITMADGREQTYNVGSVDKVTVNDAGPGEPTSAVLLNNGRDSVSLPLYDFYINSVSMDDKGNAIVHYSDNGPKDLVIPVAASAMERIEKLPGNRNAIRVTDAQGEVHDIDLQTNTSLRLTGSGATRKLEVVDHTGHVVASWNVPDTFITNVTSDTPGVSTIHMNNGKTFDVPGLAGVTFDRARSEFVFTWGKGSTHTEPTRISVAGGYPTIDVTGTETGAGELVITDGAGKVTKISLGDTWMTGASIVHDDKGANPRIEWIFNNPGADGSSKAYTPLPRNIDQVTVDENVTDHATPGKTGRDLVITWTDGTVTRVPLTSIRAHTAGDGPGTLPVVAFDSGDPSKGDHGAIMLPFFSPEGGATTNNETHIVDFRVHPVTGQTIFVTADGVEHGVVLDKTMTGATRDNDGNLVFTDEAGDKTVLRVDAMTLTPLTDPEKPYMARLTSPGADGLAGTADDVSVDVVTADAQVTGISRKGTTVTIHREYRAGHETVGTLPDMAIELDNSVTHVDVNGDGQLVITFVDGVKKTIPLDGFDIAPDSHRVTISDDRGGHLVVGIYDPGSALVGVTTSKEGVTTLTFADGHTEMLNLSKRVAKVHVTDGVLTVTFNDKTRKDMTLDVRDRVRVTRDNGVVTIVAPDGSVSFPEKDTYIDKVTEVRPGVYDVVLNDGTVIGSVDLSKHSRGVRVDGDSLVLDTPTGSVRGKIGDMFATVSTGPNGKEVTFGYAGTNLTATAVIADNHISAVNRVGDVITITTSQGIIYPIVLPEHVTDIRDTPDAIEIVGSDGKTTHVEKRDSHVVVDEKTGAVGLVTPDGMSLTFAPGGIYATKVERVGDSLVITLSDGTTHTTSLPQSVGTIGVDGGDLVVSTDKGNITVPITRTAWVIDKQNGGMDLVAIVPGVDAPVRLPLTDTFITAVDSTVRDDGTTIVTLTRSDGHVWTIPIMGGDTTLVSVVRSENGGFVFTFADGRQVTSGGIRAVQNASGEVTLIGADGSTYVIGSKGAPGDSGRSAYELWREKPGNSGKSLDEYLAYLAGHDVGSIGTPGDPGKDGRDGRIKLGLETCDNGMSLLPWLAVPAVLGLVAGGIQVAHTVNLPGFEGVHAYLNDVQHNEAARIAVPVLTALAVASAAGIGIAAINEQCN